MSQLLKGRLGGSHLLEGAHLPQFPADHLVGDVSQQVLEEGVGVHNLSGVSIQQQNAVLRGRKKLAVANLGGGQRCLHLPARRDVTDVALDDVLAVFGIHVADELYGDPLAFPGLQGQVLIADIFLVLQLLKGLLGGRHVLEGTDLPQFIADHLVVGVSQQVLEVGVGLHDLPAVRVQEQNAILRRLKEPAVANLGGAPRCVHLFAFRAVVHRSSFNALYSFLPTLPRTARFHLQAQGLIVPRAPRLPLQSARGRRGRREVRADPHGQVHHSCNQQ